MLSTPFMEIGRNCASALFNDYCLASHHSIRFSAIFEWLLSHGDQFVPTQFNGEPITASLQCSAAKLIPLWFFSLDHRKAEFSKVCIHQLNDF